MTSETEEASTQFFLNLTLILFLILLIQHYMIRLITRMVSHILEQTLSLFLKKYEEEVIFLTNNNDYLLENTAN